jgi:hypothetical protein
VDGSNNQYLHATPITPCLVPKRRTVGVITSRKPAAGAAGELAAAADMGDQAFGWATTERPWAFVFIDATPYRQTGSFQELSSEVRRSLWPNHADKCGTHHR